MRSRLELAPEVEAALAEGRPVVALETALVSHGLPHPRNLETMASMTRLIREAGAVPATVGLLDGAIRVGLDDDALARFATDPGALKVSRRDVGPVLVTKGLGATTVAGTMLCAALAGIRVMATGGIGGVHRGGETSLDISADLAELARTDVAVVCSGAKSILDLGRTLEVLETAGVPVVGYGVDRLPAFHLRSSDLPLVARVESPAGAAALIKARAGLGGGVVIANPVPERAALGGAEYARWLARAEAEAAGIGGGALTPFLLDRLVKYSAGRTLAANVALLEANAALAARIAGALAALDGA